MTDPAALEARRQSLLKSIGLLKQTQALVPNVKRVGDVLADFEAEVERIDAQLKEGCAWQQSGGGFVRDGIFPVSDGNGGHLYPCDLPRAAMGEREITELANQCLADHGFEPHRGAEFLLARLAIRETLRRVPGWPGEAELRNMAEQCGDDCYEWKAAMKMARRLKARMGAGGEE